MHKHIHNTYIYTITHTYTHTHMTGTGWPYLKSCPEKYGQEGVDILRNFPVDYANYQRTRNVSQALLAGAQQIRDKNIIL